MKKARGSFSSPVLFRNYGGPSDNTPAWRRVSASARLPGIRRHPGFHEHLTRSRGRWKWRPRLFGSSAWIPSGPAREQGSDNGCSENGRVGLLRRSAHVLTPRSSAGTTDTFGVSVVVSRKRGHGVVSLAARRLRSPGKRNGRQATVRCKEQSLIGVLGLALTGCRIR